MSKWGVNGSGNGQFFNPQGIAVSASGYIYVVDTGNNRIQEFTSSGAYVTQWGSSGSGNGQFNTPIGIAVNSNGNIYVADACNYRIQEFSPSGAYVTQWGSYLVPKISIPQRELRQTQPDISMSLIPVIT